MSKKNKKVSQKPLIQRLENVRLELVRWVFTATYSVTIYLTKAFMLQASTTEHSSTSRKQLFSLLWTWVRNVEKLLICVVLVCVIPTFSLLLLMLAAVLYVVEQVLVSSHLGLTYTRTKLFRDHLR